LPGSVLAVRAFRACNTQWRVGMAGATGLDGAACAELLERLLPKWQRELKKRKLANEDDALMRYTVADALEDLHVLECATLEAWGERRETERGEQA